MKYILAKDFVSPLMTIKAGVTKTEEEWMKNFPGLLKGDCAIKGDWFMPDIYQNQHIQEIRFSDVQKQTILKTDEFASEKEQLMKRDMINNLSKSILDKLPPIRSKVGDMIIYSIDIFVKPSIWHTTEAEAKHLAFSKELERLTDMNCKDWKGVTPPLNDGGVDFFSNETGWLKASSWDILEDKIVSGEKGVMCSLKEFWKDVSNRKQFTLEYP